MASRSKKTLTLSTITVSPAEPLLLGKSPLDNPKRPRPCPPPPPRDRIPRPVLFLHPSSLPPERAPPLRCFSSPIALSIYLLSSVILCINQLVLVSRLGRLTAPVTHTPSYPAFDVPHNAPLHSRLSSTDRPKIRFPHLGRSVPCDHGLRTLVATSMTLGTAI